MLRKELLVMNASRLCLQVEMMLKFARIIRKFNKGFNKEIRGSRCDVDMDGERVGRCVCRCDAHRSAKTGSPTFSLPRKRVVIGAPQPPLAYCVNFITRCIRPKLTNQPYRTNGI
uniref:RING finger protein 141 n=1 Tax=Parascaris univalens TaxID=6257 RepID=A0A915C3M2_PARUN